MLHNTVHRFCHGPGAQLLSHEIRMPPPARKTIDLEGRVVKDGVRKTLRDRQLALTELVHAIREFRTIADSKPITFQGSEYAEAVQELNKAIDRAESFRQ